MKSQILRDVEEWTGHGPARRAARSAILKTLGILCLLLAALLLASCSYGPSITTRPDGTRTVAMSRSLMQKSAAETASWTNGAESITWSTSGADSTVVPSKIVGSYTTLGLAKELTTGLRTTESTKRILSKEETTRAANKLNAGTEALRIKNPIIPETAPVPVP